MSNIQVCSTCEAKVINGQHFWSTGNPGNFLDLAGLVCNSLCGDRHCINPCRGMTGGETWAGRRANLDAAMAEHDLNPGSIPETLAQ